MPLVITHKPLPGGFPTWFSHQQILQLSEKTSNTNIPFLISNCTNMICDIRHLSNILIHNSFPLVGTILVNWLYSWFIHLLVRHGERKDHKMHSVCATPKMNKYCIFVISVFCCQHHKIVHIMFMSVVSNFEIYSVTHLICYAWQIWNQYALHAVFFLFP